jgi:hypothetical protein
VANLHRRRILGPKSEGMELMSPISPACAVVSTMPFASPTLGLVENLSRLFPTDATNGRGWFLPIFRVGTVLTKLLLVKLNFVLQ